MAPRARRVRSGTPDARRVSAGCRQECSSATPRCMEDVCNIGTTGQHLASRTGTQLGKTAGQTPRVGTGSDHVKWSNCNWGSRGREFKSPQPDHEGAGQRLCADLHSSLRAELHHICTTRGFGAIGAGGLVKPLQTVAEGLRPPSSGPGPARTGGLPLHDRVVRWVGGSFDPTSFDLASANVALQQLH